MKPTELTEDVIPFRTDDGMTCQLRRVLVHGAGVRSKIFRARVDETLVDALVQAGYDVWLEDWRASINLPANRWNLDQAARYDHPAAIRTIVERTGYDRVKAVIHCQGSTSFMMSVAAGWS